MSTYFPKKGDIHQEWILIDASGQRLGRLATRAASFLRGKHRPTFTPFLDVGDFVVVVNADKIETTGRKLEQKQYFRHSMQPGGGKFTPLKKALAEKPDWVIRKAIWGMLPHNVLGRRMFRKLKVYCGPNHPHEAQRPTPWMIER
ncbi:MAG: 50S ribosomal protein L13 [Calditrichota bacterium]